MDWENFTPFASLIGGALIGLAASILYFFNGRICGISGISFQIMAWRKNEVLWRVLFLCGLIIGGLLGLAYFPLPYTAFTLDRPSILIALAGALVGIGTRLGNGCTSGHGVCGISRFNKASLWATITFMTTGIVTVTVLRLLGVGDG